MRLIDADRLIVHLSDYALSEVHEGDDDKVYRAIMDCINAVEEAETIHDTNVIKLIPDENGKMYGYDSKYILTILHKTEEDMEDTKQILKNLPRWVPVSERLPEVAGLSVLATIENKVGQRRVCEVFTGYGHTNEPFWHSNNKEYDLAVWNVLAWQPLPGTYQETKNDDYYYRET